MMKLSERDREWLRSHPQVCDGREQIIQIARTEIGDDGRPEIVAEIVKCGLCGEGPKPALRAAIDRLKRESGRSDISGVPEACTAVLDYIKQLETFAHSIRQYADTDPSTTVQQKLKHVRARVKDFEPVLKSAE